MDPISIRYGESLTLPIDAGDTTATSADIYIGKPGEAFILSGTAELTDGQGAFVFSKVQTKIPLGKYKYQINITDETDYIEKYPSPEGCEGEEGNFPDFIVAEALDEQEVS